MMRSRRVTYTWPASIDRAAFSEFLGEWERVCSARARSPEEREIQGRVMRVPRLRVAVDANAALLLEGRTHLREWARSELEAL